MNKNKKILTLENLEQFYSKYKKSMSFSSAKTGYQLAVQVPASFAVAQENNDDTLMFCIVKCFHIGANRNKSNVTEDAAKKAMKTMAYKPILANFTTTESGEIDFTSHDFELDDSGNMVYLEHQIGCFTADEPYIEHDDELDKDFVYAVCAIPRSYTSAVDVIERKGGTKVSVELLVNELNYDAKAKILNLTDITVQGLTCLGTDPNTGKQVEEGMLGSRLDIKDFSESNNSIFSSLTEEENSKIIEMQEKIAELEATLSRFNINTEIRKGGDTLNKELLENLLSKYAKTQEELTFEIEGLSDEELEAAFAKAFEVEEEPTSYEEKKLEDVVEEAVSEEGEPAALSDDVESVSEAQNNEPETEETVEETESDNTDEDEASDNGDSEDFAKCKKKCEEDSEDDEEDDDEVTENEACKPKKKCEEDSEEDETNEEFKGKKKNEVAEFTKNFTLSMEDIRCGLYNLLFEVEQTDNDCYGICQTFDVYFIHQSYCTGKTYKQTYSINGDNVAFEGSRVEVFAEYLTQEEKDQLQSMRANYSLIVDKLSKYEAAELKAEKEAIFADEAYADFIESDGFKTIRDNMDTYSVDELRNACELQFAKEVRANKNFALEKPVKEVKKAPAMFAFAKQEVNNEFLDSLLKTAKNK